MDIRGCLVVCHNPSLHFSERTGGRRGMCVVCDDWPQAVRETEGYQSMSLESKKPLYVIGLCTFRLIPASLCSGMLQLAAIEPASTSCSSDV